MRQAPWPGEPRLIAEAIDSTSGLTDPAAVERRVREAYEEVGWLLRDEEEAAILTDLACADCPVVSVSKGFTSATGFTLEHLAGRNCRVMLQGVPEVAISKSARKNLRDFCRMCRMPNLEAISQVTALQPNVRLDGSHFMNFFLVGRVTVRQRAYLLSLQRAVAEGLLVKLNSQAIQEVAESVRAAYLALCNRLQGLCGADGPAAPLASASRGDDAGDLAAGPLAATPRSSSSSRAPGFAFFGERLQDHCLLLNGGLTAVRREPQELATSCLVFGDQPARHSAEGVYFALRVDDAVSTFEGLPVLGFTRRRPVDAQDLYPTVSRCLGASVLCGACGEAFARDKWEHFVIGFKPPPLEEVQSWALHPTLPPHKRRAPVAVKAGDVLGCYYGYDGHIRLHHNGVAVLDFDLGRPASQDVEYYAVVDVCLSAYSVTILPATSLHEEAMLVGLAHPQQLPILIAEERQERPPVVSTDEATAQLVGDIDTMVSNVVHDAGVSKAIRKIIAQCEFCVTVADPRGDDFPLIAVSEGFEAMTGYRRSEIIGANCRFLNQGCPVSPTDLVGLRSASANGSAFTALLPNRKKSGEKFVNLLDLRGITIGKHLDTGEDLWYLVGIQADVTGLSGSDIPEGHFRELQEVANMIRTRLRKELSRLAAEAADCFDREHSSSSTSSQHDLARAAWKLLEEPVWTSSVPSQQADHADPASGMDAERQEPSRARRSIACVAPLGGRPERCMVILSLLVFAAGVWFGRATRRR